MYLTFLIKTKFCLSTAYYVYWDGIEAKVIRPDVECVNGVVHVIDTVLMKRRDVTVNSANNQQSPATICALVFSSFLTLILAKAFH